MNKVFAIRTLKIYRKTSWLLLLVFAFALPVMADDPIIEYGQPEELRGVTKVFVDTGVDAQQRELVVKEIRKQLPDLEIVSRPEDSDVHFRFSQQATRDGRTEAVGTVVKLIGGNRVRVLCSFKDNLPPIFERGSIIYFGMEHTKPHRFAREFVKVYSKANG